MKLLNPISFGKTQITELKFRDYTTAADYLSYDKRGGVAQRVALIASLTGTDESLIEQLRGPDYLRAEKIATDMMLADELEAFPKPGDAESALEKKSDASS
ncbi:phage tail assembly protein [Methylomonas sp. EFPC1]|uniref:phage tail assembly protein n=1 Tax=Methylomonas sp. EFPC1 TaxID=2812647 RepID=UPI0019683E3E|nr:phage tail assembly protein [Methylomonas sp. EFPC1]QSB03459.1 phage tail assembly protein [Methylomonas sp. EFPC1]